MATSPQPRGVSRLPVRTTGPSANATPVLALALAWHERARQRRRLMQLDARALDDIGVRPDEAERECRRPFWRPFWPPSLDLP